MKNILKFALVCAVLALPGASFAEDKNYAEAGMLKCTKSGDETNILLHSQYPIECTFDDAEGGTEKYTGKTGIAVGLTLQKTDAAELHFAVLAAGDLKLGNKSLRGNYVGAKVSLAGGKGAGVAVLLGGGEDNIALQPLAIEKSEGVGVAAGVGFLTLK